MSSDALLMAMVGMLCWGIAPLFGKVGLRQIDPLLALSARTLMAGFCVLCYLLLSGGFQRFTRIPAGAWAFIGTEAFLATLAGDLAYFAALKLGQASEVSLVMAASPLITLWLCLLFLNEKATTITWFGALLIAIGLVLIGLKTQE